MCVQEILKISFKSFQIRLYICRPEYNVALFRFFCCFVGFGFGCFFLGGFFFGFFLFFCFLFCFGFFKLFLKSFYP